MSKQNNINKQTRDNKNLQSVTVLMQWLVAFFKWSKMADNFSTHTPIKILLINRADFVWVWKIKAHGHSTALKKSSQAII
jgi:hypothetical protein